MPRPTHTRSCSRAVGADNAFTVTDDATTGTVLNMTSRLSTASNAELTVNGVAVERSTNVIDDVVTGMTLTLAGPTASTSVISVAGPYRCRV